MNQLSAESDPTIDLKRAAYDVKEVTDLAHRTGAVDEYHDLDGRPGRYGVGIARANYQYYDDYEGPAGAEYRSDDYTSLATDDAAVYQGDEFAKAKTKEPTGNYSTADFIGGDVGGGVAVVRPDGNGGQYRGHIGGKYSEKATAIVARRAAKKVRRAVVDRAISIGDELLQEQDRVSS